MPEYGLLTDEQLLAVEDEIWTPARTQQLIENVRYWKARHAVLVKAVRGMAVRRMAWLSAGGVTFCRYCQHAFPEHEPYCDYGEIEALVEGEDAEA